MYLLQLRVTSSGGDYILTQDEIMTVKTKAQTHIRSEKQAVVSLKFDANYTDIVSKDPALFKASIGNYFMKQYPDVLFDNFIITEGI